MEAESIAIWESEQKAIQRKLAQESIKEKLIKETLVVGETLTIPATNYEETFIKEIIPLESIDEVENHIGQKKQIENEEKLDNKIKKKLDSNVDNKNNIKEKNSLFNINFDFFKSLLNNIIKKIGNILKPY